MMQLITSSDDMMYLNYEVLRCQSVCSKSEYDVSIRVCVYWGERTRGEREQREEKERTVMGKRGGRGRNRE